MNFLDILYEICFGQGFALDAFMWIPMAVGAGLGVAKQANESAIADRERKRQAEIQRWSPWTGLQGKQVQSPSLFGNVAQGAFAGGMAGNAFGGGEAPGSALTQNVMGGTTPMVDPSMKYNMYR